MMAERKRGLVPLLIDKSQVRLLHIQPAKTCARVGYTTTFDGINLTPQQLDDVTSYPLITKALVEKDMLKKTLRKYWVEIF